MENNQTPPQPPVPSSPPEQNIPAVPPIPPLPKFKFPILLSVIIALFLIVGSAAAAYFFVNRASQQVACTMEAKICPDGSSVGRSGPNCEFSLCPTPKPTTDPTANWKTYSNSKYGYSLKYPGDWIIEDKPQCLDGVYFYPPQATSEYTSSGCRESNTLTSYVVSDSIYINAAKQNREQGYIGQISKITVDNKEAEKEIKGPSAGVWVYINYKEVIYIVGKPGDNSTISDQTFDHILSTFRFTNSNPSPTCIPRPACLDATPRCLIPEPANGWCP